MRGTHATREASGQRSESFSLLLCSRYDSLWSPARADGTIAARVKTGIARASLRKPAMQRQKERKGGRKRDRHRERGRKKREGLERDRHNQRKRQGERKRENKRARPHCQRAAGRQRDIQLQANLRGIALSANATDCPSQALVA